MLHSSSRSGKRSLCSSTQQMMRLSFTSHLYSNPLVATAATNQQATRLSIGPGLASMRTLTRVLTVVEAALLHTVIRDLLGEDHLG